MPGKQWDLYAETTVDELRTALADVDRAPVDPYFIQHGRGVTLQAVTEGPAPVWTLTAQHRLRHDGVTCTLR